MLIQEYIDNVNKRFKSGISTEHSYRGDLQYLLESIVPDVQITNEPSRIACGAPDYIITKRNIPVGYIEAKDIGKSLDSPDYEEQFDRYKKSLPNLIITDYLDFQLYREGVFATSVSIAYIQNGKIISKPQNHESFKDSITDFCTYVGQTITSASKLSKMMAGKARLLANVIENALTKDEEIGNHVNEAANITLKEQLEAFKSVLIHDISPKTFADIYAQTIAYGMFAARLHDPSIENFSRQEAAELIPKSNPFLRKLFQYIAGYDLDDRIKWIVDDLADIFRATDVAALLKDFGKTTQQNDPMIHFYETFLSEYDPRLRKSRGVYYTPEPVVNFIVRAVDDILKTEFGLPQGLADTSQVEIEVDDQGTDKRRSDGKRKIKQKVHKVQILDPAAGTGTFLAEVVKQIYKKFEGQQGIWSQYVEDHLIPRLHGFEILMAPYTMAHLKLELLLQETGYKPKKNQRLRVFLTNSLEEFHPDTGTLFAGWLSSEANEANQIKRDTPVMCVIGNPPYSISSSNKSEWIEKLIADYKLNLNERNIQPLSDDYIKFIRLGQYYVDKNGEGILAYISNNTFIDGIIHRQIRKCLLDGFNCIYILDLHGNSKKKETTADGSSDQNVFDIMQGVSINIFVRIDHTTKKLHPRIFHYDLLGKRYEKYKFLNATALQDISWNELKPKEPNYIFIQKDYEGITVYEQGFKVDQLFKQNTSGIKTQKDDVCISFLKKEAEDIRLSFIQLPIDEIRSKYNLEDVRDWKVSFAKNDLLKNPVISTELLYRPFDFRFMNYTGTTKGIMGYPRYKGMRHVLKDNISLIFVLQSKAANINFYDCIFISKIPTDTNLFRRGGPQLFPLYQYPEKNKEEFFGFSKSRRHNLNETIIKTIETGLKLKFTTEKENVDKSFAPIDILDYIYAILHSPTYRERFKEFLLTDFPRVPYPKDKKVFWHLVKHGGELRQIHLLESPVVKQYITTYPIDGNNKVDKVKYEGNKVWINEEQYFNKVPPIAWEFYIGGYQPAQKWLKDRKGRIMSYEDIMHYQKIIVALTETDRIMKEIDKVDFL
jgi:predicted helicase